MVAISTTSYLASLLATVLIAVCHGVDGSAESHDGASTHYTCYDDMSWAVNSQEVSSELGRRDVYQSFLDGCRRVAGHERCQAQENWRMQMNMYQPRSMYNYTKTGFMKARASDHLFRLLRDFWEANRHRSTDEWSEVSTYHNHWEVATRMVPVENRSFVGGGPHLRDTISNVARDLLEEWTGMQLVTTSTYGSFRQLLLAFSGCRY